MVPGSGGGGAENGRSEAGDIGGGLGPDSVVNSALRFRAQAPLIDQLLRARLVSRAGDVQHRRPRSAGSWSGRTTRPTAVPSRAPNASRRVAHRDQGLYLDHRAEAPADAVGAASATSTACQVGPLQRRIRASREGTGLTGSAAFATFASRTAT